MSLFISEKQIKNKFMSEKLTFHEASHYYHVQHCEHISYWVSHIKEGVWSTKPNMTFDKTFRLKVPTVRPGLYLYYTHFHEKLEYDCCQLYCITVRLHHIFCTWNDHIQLNRQFQDLLYGNFLFDVYK